MFECERFESRECSRAESRGPAGPNFHNQVANDLLLIVSIKIQEHGTVETRCHQAESRLVALHQSFRDGHETVEILTQRCGVFLEHPVCQFSGEQSLTNFVLEKAFDRASAIRQIMKLEQYLVGKKNS